MRREDYAQFMIFCLRYTLARSDHSLGLATCPNLRFLKEVSSGEGGREDNRKKKNKSRKLERLKMQIKEEKLKKRIEKIGGKGKIEEEEEEEEVRECVKGVRL